VAAVRKKKKRRQVAPHRRVIGEAVRHRRKAALLTQEQLAERVDLNPKYLGEVERGEKIISIEALLRIAKALKTPMRQFFPGL
jgi:transcriptional regulator with XRE-family HTH domain